LSEHDAAGSDHGMRQNWVCDKRGASASKMADPIEIATPVRNIVTDAALLMAVCAGRHSQRSRKEVAMATKQRGRIVETPTEARQAEPGPSVLALLTVSTGLAILVLGVVWFVFFRT
jgi:hypothetical protein